MKISKILIVLAFIIALVGSMVYAQNCDVPFTSVLKIQNSGFCSAQDWVIDNQSDFCIFWNQAYAMSFPVPPCPTIDFDTYVVIVTAMGQKRNGCYDTQITCIEDDGHGNYTVYVKDTYPQPKQYCPQIMVCPVHAVKASIPSGTVSFQHFQ